MCMGELTLAEAQKTCAGLSHLIRASSFRGDHIDIVEAILPAPCDPRDQWVFYNMYCLTKDLEIALKQYENCSFDVIVLIRECYPDGLFSQNYITLEAYFQSNSRQNTLQRGA